VFESADKTRKFIGRKLEPIQNKEKLETYINKSNTTMAANNID
jgi:hypothetical protein